MIETNDNSIEKTEKTAKHEETAAGEKEILSEHEKYMFLRGYRKAISDLLNRR